MKRLILRLTVMILAFALGVGVQRAMLKDRASQIQAPQPVAMKLPEPVVHFAPSQPVVAAARHMVFDYNPKTFHPEGGYVLMGRKPKEFAEFQYMFLGLDNVVDGQMWGIVSVGTVTNDKYDDQTAIFGLVSERRVFFVTPTFQGGFEYRFDGEFLRRDLWSANQNTAVLRGTLTKTIKGRKAAERVVSFRIEEDHC
ncbi:MAG TPA: hypothetical protein VF074_18295 [Pyrinomonadaceae bacterium]